MAEWLVRGKPSILGFCSGAVAGLVVITPACGFVDSKGAFIIGVLAGLIPFFACWKIKAWLGYDDALDTFGVHAVGGTLGAFMTGILATSSVNGNLTDVNTYAKDNGLAKLVADGGLVFEQLKAITITLVLSVVATAVIAYIVRAVIGLRPSEK
jgi:Amt family ammonium transporter